MAPLFNLAALKMYFKFSFLLVWCLCGPGNSKVIALWLCKMYMGSSVLKHNLCFSGDLMQQHASSPEGCPRKRRNSFSKVFSQLYYFLLPPFLFKDFTKIFKCVNGYLDQPQKKKICHRVKCGKDEVRSSQPQSQSKTKNSSAEFIISVNLIMIVIVWGAFQCNNR